MRWEKSFANSENRSGSYRCGRTAPYNAVRPIHSASRGETILRPIHSKITWGFLFVVLLGGCVTNSYEVELMPRGSSVERKLVFERHGTQNGNKVVEFPDPDELPRLAGAYQVDVPEREKWSYEFRGEFRGRIPDDLGNVGSLTHWHTQFGSATVHYRTSAARSRPCAANTFSPASPRPQERCRT